MRHEATLTKGTTKTVIYIVCTFLAVLSIFPFWVMFMNATRGTYEIQQNSVALITKYVVQDGKCVMWEDSEYAAGKRKLKK